ncbi:MAG TPA: hypothetical protein VN087_08130 [Verrucomicrobiae bacterium]|nr:hypothetical protein [Verrucomicrobiae bacterium]
MSKRRPSIGFSVVKYALGAFRYLVTGFVALLLALLLVLLFVEVGAAIGAALEHAHEDIPASGNFGSSVTGRSAQGKWFLWRAGDEVSFIHPRADFGLATHYSGATTRSAQPSASFVVQF